jgi:ribosome-binding factor A
MKRPTPTGRPEPKGPTQRQLRAGELVRHVLVDIFREEEIADPVMAGVSVTVTEVRISPDMRHAIVFVEPLGGENHTEVVAALNKHSKFIRGRLGKLIVLRFTPDLKFLHDESYNEAARMRRLFDNPHIQQDLTPQPPSDSWKDDD